MLLRSTNKDMNLGTGYLGLIEVEGWFRVRGIERIRKKGPKRRGNVDEYEEGYLQQSSRFAHTLGDGCVLDGQQLKFKRWSRKVSARTMVGVTDSN